MKRVNLFLAGSQRLRSSSCLHRPFLSQRPVCAARPSPSLTNTTCLQSSRVYSSSSSSGPPLPPAPSVQESASQLAAHLAEHPAKLDYMVKVLTQQLASIRQEVQRKDKDFEPEEAAAVLDALGSTLDTLMPAVTGAEKQKQLQGLLDEIVQLRTTL